MRLGGAALCLLILVYVIVLGGGLYFCVFADPDTSPTALYLTETLPHKVWSLLQRILPEQTLRVLEFVVERTLQIVYLAIFLGTCNITVFFIFPLLDSQKRVSRHHKYVIFALMAATWLSWRYASTVSPGIITPRNLHRYNHYPFDERLYFVPGIRCPTRGILRPARSKFDRSKYNENVPRFDHYCGWVNNTIGEENYRFFLFFLMMNVIDCIYGTIMLTKLFCGHLIEKDILNAVVVDRVSGQEYPVGMWIIFQYLFDRFTWQMAVYMLVLVMAVAIGLFFLYHCYLTSRNVTTNEAFKWEQVHKWYKMELQRYIDATVRGEIHGSDESSDATHTKDDDMSPITRASSDTPIQAALPEKEAIQHPGRVVKEAIQHPGPRPKNTYDRGFVENWKEVIFPLSLRKIDSKSTTAHPKIN
jgi:palmitoyltransferase ZDHHC4